MKIYIGQVISNLNPLTIRISQEGFRTVEAARDWGRKKPGIKEELQNGWRFVAEDCEYRIHDILVR